MSKLLFYLRRQNDECDANHDDHVELRRPNVWDVVAVADRGERHHHVVGAAKEKLKLHKRLACCFRVVPLEQVHMTMTRPLMVGGGMENVYYIN